MNVADQIKPLFVAETRLLRRSPASLLTAVGVPVGMIAVFVLAGRRNLGELGWAFPVAALFLVMFGMSVAMTTTLTLTARREDLYLKRLRTSEASDATILVGLVSPVLVLAALQCLAVVATVGVAGPQWPRVPLLVLVAVVLGLAMSAAWGAAATGWVSGTAQADMASLPFFFFIIGTGMWAGTAGAEGPGLLLQLSPGGGVLELARLAYLPTPLSTLLIEAAVASGVLVAWTAFGVVLARRSFRWEPRT